MKSTFAYLFKRGRGKHFLFVFLTALAPSAAFGYGVRTDAFLVNTVGRKGVANFGKLWMSHFGEKHCLAGILIGCATSLLATAIIVGMLVRHFRTADFKIKYVAYSINDYFVPVILNGMTITSIALVSFTLYVLISMLWNAVLSSGAAIALSLVFLAIIGTGAFYAVSSLTLWLPMMCIKGDYSPAALSRAFYKSRDNQKYFFPAYVGAMLVILVVMIVTYFVNVSWVSWLAHTLGYAWIYTFMTVFAVVTYFDTERLPREDLKVSPYKRSA